MRVLCSSVLGIESIVVFLCFLVASTNGSFESQALAVWLGVGAMIVLLLSIGVVTRPWGPWWGSFLQIVVVALGFLVPLMFIVGGIFAVLWYFAVRNGSRVDRLRAAKAQLVGSCGHAALLARLLIVSHKDRVKSRSRVFGDNNPHVGVCQEHS
jgi:hypothetical protein